MVMLELLAVAGALSQVMGLGVGGVVSGALLTVSNNRLGLLALSTDTVPVMPL